MSKRQMFVEGGSTISFSCTSVTSAAQSLGNVGSDLLLTNIGESVAYVNFGTLSTITAATTDLPVPAGTQFTRPRDVISELYAAAICDSGATTTLKITPGTGS